MICATCKSRKRWTDFSGNCYDCLTGRAPTTAIIGTRVDKPAKSIVNQIIEAKGKLYKPKTKK
jgi:hypothetical protein